MAVLLASGASAAVFSFVYTWIRFSYGTLSPTLLVAMFTVRVISGMILAGWLGRVIARSLHRTGALDGLRIDEDRRA